MGPRNPCRPSTRGKPLMTGRCSSLSLGQEASSSQMWPSFGCFIGTCAGNWSGLRDHPVRRTGWPKPVTRSAGSSQVRWITNGRRSYSQGASTGDPPANAARSCRGRDISNGRVVHRRRLQGAAEAAMVQVSPSSLLAHQACQVRFRKCARTLHAGERSTRSGLYPIDSAAEGDATAKEAALRVVLRKET
jgi:hypothetical protein